MFDYFNGTITDKRKTSKGCYITVEVTGTGYLIEISESDFIKINLNNETQKIYVLLQHREDIMSLFGFLNKETRDIFQILISVSGVGAKMGLALLNEFDVCDLITLVIDGNYKELTRAKGVGPKLAQKIILELKDKLIKTDLPKISNGIIDKNPAITDAETVLLSLGYNEKEIENAFAKILSNTDNNNSEEILRKALTTLSV